MLNFITFILTVTDYHRFIKWLRRSPSTLLWTDCVWGSLRVSALDCWGSMVQGKPPHLKCWLGISPCQVEQPTSLVTGQFLIHLNLSKAIMESLTFTSEFFFFSTSNSCSSHLWPLCSFCIRIYFWNLAV